MLNKLVKKTVFFVVMTLVAAMAFGNVTFAATTTVGPVIVGSSVWRTSAKKATVKFYSDSVGTYYYYVTDDDDIPSVSDIKEASSGVYGNDGAVVGINSIDLTGLSSGEQYVYILVDNGTTSDILTVEMPYDVYYYDDFEIYEENTASNSSVTQYTLKYEGTGSGNQKIISSEQIDGYTGKVLQLQGRNSWASEVRHAFTPDNEQYMVIEASVKPVSGTSPSSVTIASSSAGGTWTNAVCRFGLEDNGFWYGKNDTSTDADTNLTYSNGNWYDTKLILDRTNNLFYISIDDSFVNNEGYEAASATPEWFSLTGGNIATNTVYYDNIKVYTTDSMEDLPEVTPTTYTARVYAIDVANGEEMEGATIQIIDSQGTVVKEWISVSEGYEAEELNCDEEYILRVIVAPEGYTIATDTTFTIDSDGRITSTGSTTTDEGGNTVLLVEIAKTHVEVSSVKSSDGYELDGVTIQILDREGNVVEEWESTTEKHVIEGLKTGEEYTLAVTVVPNNYVLPTSSTFIIDEEGNVTSTGSVTADGVMLVEVSKEDAPVTYEVTLNPNGGSVTPTSIEVEEDGTYGELPIPEPAEEGINFLGWFKSRVVYDDNACFNDTTITNYVVRATPAADMNHHNSGVHYFNYGDILVFNVTVPDAEILRVDLNDTYIPTSCYTISEDGHNVKGVVEITNSYDIWYVLDFIDVEITKDVDPYDYDGYTINEFSIYKTPVTSETNIENVAHSLIAGWDTLTPVTTVKYTLTVDLNGGTAGTEFQESEQLDANTEGPILDVPESFAIAPEGYEFDALEINGVRYEVGSTYTLIEDANIKILWKLKETIPTDSASSSSGKSSSGSIIPSSYKITTNIENGTVTPNAASMKKNESKEFRFKANEGYKITDVLVDGKSIGVVDSYIIEKVRANHTIEVKTAKAGKTVIEENNESATAKEDNEEISLINFEDVSKTDSFYSDVKYAVKNRLFSGISKTEFGPNIKITRGMLVTVLYKFANGKEIGLSDFEDVDKEEYYSAPIAWATKNGFVSGIGDNKFAPDANVTRQDLATILYKYVKSQGKGFTGMWMFLLDAADRDEIEEYAYEPVCWFVMNNVYSTDKNNKINPTNEVTRIETIQIFRKISDLLK